MGNQLWGTSLTTGEFVEQPELISPPVPKRMQGKLLLWTLTLLSFLGGTYYGFLFRGVAPASAELSLVDNGSALVARWNARVVAEAGTAELRVTEEGREQSVHLDRQAIERGEIVLEAAGDFPLEAALSGKGIAGHARYIPEDGVEATGGSDTIESLRRQLTEQEQRNSEMERRLAAAKR